MEKKSGVFSISTCSTGSGFTALCCLRLFWPWTAGFLTLFRLVFSIVVQWMPDRLTLFILPDADAVRLHGCTGRRGIPLSIVARDVFHLVGGDIEVEIAAS